MSEFGTDPEPIPSEGRTVEQICGDIALLRKDGFRHDELRIHAGRLREPIESGKDRNGKVRLISKVSAGDYMFGVLIV